MRRTAEYSLFPSDGILCIRALDGEGLARARLSVGEDRAVVTLEATVGNGARDLLEDDVLVDVFISNVIEVEGFVAVDANDSVVFYCDTFFVPTIA